MTSQFYRVFLDQKEDSPSGIPLERTALGRMMDNETELNETGEESSEVFRVRVDQTRHKQRQCLHSHNQRYALAP